MPEAEGAGRGLEQKQKQGGEEGSLRGLEEIFSFTLTSCTERLLSNLHRLAATLYEASGSINGVEGDRLSVPDKVVQASVVDKVASRVSLVPPLLQRLQDVKLNKGGAGQGASPARPAARGRPSSDKPREYAVMRDDQQDPLHALAQESTLLYEEAQDHKRASILSAASPRARSKDLPSTPRSRSKDLPSSPRSRSKDLPRSRSKEQPSPRRDKELRHAANPFEEPDPPGGRGSLRGAPGRPPVPAP